MPTGPLLALERATRTFPGDPPVVALRDANLVVRAGEMVAVVGRSGSGKSTLLNLLGLLDTPSVGRYLVAGFDSTELSDSELTALRARFFGFVFQRAHLLSTRTASENVELALFPHQLRKRERRDRVAEALNAVGVAHRAHAFPTTLSGGEAQRVAVARAMAPRPEVLLCDEPTGNLDSVTAGQILALLQDLNRAGMTILVVTHDEAIAHTMTRRVTVNDGHVYETPRVGPRP